MQLTCQEAPIASVAANARSLVSATSPPILTSAVLWSPQYQAPAKTGPVPDGKVGTALLDLDVQLDPSTDLKTKGQVCIASLTGDAACSLRALFAVMYFQGHDRTGCCQWRPCTSSRKWVLTHSSHLAGAQISISNPQNGDIFWNIDAAAAVGGSTALGATRYVGPFFPPVGFLAAHICRARQLVTVTTCLANPGRQVLCPCGCCHLHDVALACPCCGCAMKPHLCQQDMP